MAGLFLQWLYSDAPHAFWEYRKQLVVALQSYFSLSLLGKTLFDPWRHDAVDVSRLPVKMRLQAFGNNMISRLIGFNLRMWVIATGWGVIGFVSLATFIFIIIWYLLPLLLVSSIGYGLKLLLWGTV